MKKIFLLILLLFSTFGLSNIVNANREADTLVVHYLRYDGNYSNYAFHMWEYLPTSKGGKDFKFDTNNVDEYGVFFEVDLATDFDTATTLGIIVKYGMDWSGYREPGGDRYIDLSKAQVIGGKYHAYIVEKDLNIGISEADLAANKPDYRPRILTAMFSNSTTITASLTHIPTGDYELYENDTKITSGPVTSKTLNITIPNSNISKTYTLHVFFEGSTPQTKVVSLEKLYDTESFKNAYTYEGTLGVSFESGKTIFRLWAPLSENVSLNLYNQNHSNYNNQGVESLEQTPYNKVTMTKIENGAWEAKLDGDLSGKYYTFSVTNSGITSEVTDPYAYSTGANGQRGLVVNFETSNPTGWTYNTRPQTIKNFTDYIVYELHVRDLTSHSSWTGTNAYRGKFMGLSETGTRYTTRGTTVTTGLDHIAELGVNAVQLLPIFDFGYIDEVQIANNPSYNNTFNWGYMPYHFNTLEGSYSTNPFDGYARITEFKTAVMALHNKDLRVIMDVVYNHTGESDGSNFNKIMPGYYHRTNESGGFYNGSGTGNETASERPMMRKFMVDSVKFWATEYNLSGFRFDLMALHDYETMNEIKAMLKEIDPTIVVYGEPWDAGGSPLSASLKADKNNIKNMPEVGAFNDVTRDAVKGSVFEASEGGWIQGNTSDYNVQGIKYGIGGGVDLGLTSVSEWHLEPHRTINYVSAHDNNTLYDKLRLTNVSVQQAELLQVQANAIILTSQGIPFIHAGAEFMRSKPKSGGGYDHNSYESPDSVNQLRWDRKASYVNVFEYYKDLIQIRKDYQSFRLTSSTDIIEKLSFIETDKGNSVIAFKLAGDATNPEIIVVHSRKPALGMVQINLTEGKSYKILTNLEQSNANGLEVVSGVAFVPSNTTMILVEETNPVTIKKELVTIRKGQRFNPASNVTVNDKSAEINYSNFHSTKTPGLYSVTVSVKESFGKVTYYTYFLQVTGNRYDVDLGGI